MTFNLKETAMCAYPYSDNLGFGYSESDNPAPFIAKHKMKDEMNESEAYKKAAHEGKPPKMTKMIQEAAPITINFSINPDSMMDMMKAKDTIRQLEPSKGEMLLKAIDNNRPINKFGSVDGLASMLQELTPLEMKLVEKHIRVALAEIKGKKK